MTNFYSIPPNELKTCGMLFKCQLIITETVGPEIERLPVKRPATHYDKSFHIIDFARLFSLQAAGLAQSHTYCSQCLKNPM